MSRSKRAEIAKETLTIIEQGFYNNQENQKVPMEAMLQASLDGSEIYPMDYWTRNRWQELETKRTSQNFETEIRVTNETSLSASKTLIEQSGGKVLCLNFASAKNPGGGFLGGSQAQEESLARSSGLYPTLTEFMSEMYEFHRGRRTCLYSHTMIYSPAVPVFRNDRDELLPIPYLLSFLTSPAVNAGAVQKNEPQNVDKIEATMLERIDRVLAVALQNDYRNLVLGAWGCGVFRNKPADMSKWFAHFLLNDGKYANSFERITFAVLDGSANGKFISDFEAVFS